MSIHIRFVTLLASISGLLMAGILLQEYFDHNEARSLREGMARERAVLVDNMLDVTAEPLNVFVRDYSPWDDMVTFVGNADPGWARVNLTDSLDSHKLDAIWVFRPDLTEVFGTVSKAQDELRRFPLPPANLASLTSKSGEVHFFAASPLGLLEVLGAPIRASDRSIASPSPIGWLFAARLWNQPFLAKISLLTDSDASLSPVDSAPTQQKSGDDLLVITRTLLPDWSGRPLQTLNVRHRPAALQHMKDDNATDFALSLGFSCLALIAVFAGTRWWVVRPLRMLEESLAEGRPVHLEGLRTSAKEFVRLGQLVEKSFRHEQTLRQIFVAFNAIEDAVFVLDTEGRRIAHVNDGTVKLLGYSREELQGKLLSDLETERPMSAQPMPVDPTILLKTHWYRCRDGRLVEVDIREQTMPTHAVSPLQVIVARDVTDLKRQEMHRLQAQRLESLGILAGGVAHDMNNMLTPITFFLEELQQTDTRPSPELLASVQSSVKRGASILRQLLTFGRGISGERQVLDVKGLFDEIGRIVESTFPKSILLETRVALNVGAVIGDPTQLHQVLLNLCVNARDAMPTGGRLTLRADNLVVDAANHATWGSLALGRYVQIEVADTGTGIPPELIERIFEPFFTTKPIDQGTGLGLSTSLGIIQSHGGSIHVDSRVGHGTRLRFLLPAKDNTAQVEFANLLESFEGKGRTVLVIEDEENIRLILQTTLLRLSMEVLSAANGADGLAIYRTRSDKIDLVISDLHMPGMDGLELLRTIRADSPQRALVVMSGRIDERTRDAIIALNINYVLKKPFGYSEIVQALRHVFR